jgi:hypothetical protein
MLALLLLLLLLPAALFFRSRRCLRLDQSKCVPPGDENYDITRGGLDSMVRGTLRHANTLSLHSK